MRRLPTVLIGLISICLFALVACSAPAEPVAVDQAEPVADTASEPETATEEEAVAEPETTTEEEAAEDTSAETDLLADIPESERDAALISAVQDDDVVLATALVEAGVDVNTKGGYAMTPLLIAAVRGNTELVEALLAAGADAQAQDESGKNALSMAAAADNLELVELLLAEGVAVQDLPLMSANPLMQSAINGNVELGRVLIENGANVYFPDSYGDPILMFAAFYGQTEYAKMLIEEVGVSPNHIGSRQRTPVDFAEENDHAETAAYLSEMMAEDPQAGVNADLVKAIQADDLVSAEGLLKFGAEVDAVVDTGAMNLTPLAIATLRGNRAMAEMLIDKGADVNVVDANGDTLLFYAVTSGEPDIVALFLEHGLDVDVITSEFASTPLSVAARDGSVEIGEMLLDAGADIEMLDLYEDPALNSAAYYGQLAFIEMLVERGADFEVVNMMGDNALSHALGQGHTDTAEYLRELGLTEPS